MSRGIVIFVGLQLVAADAVEAIIGIYVQLMAEAVGIPVVQVDIAVVAPGVGAVVGLQDPVGDTGRDVSNWSGAVGPQAVVQQGSADDHPDRGFLVEEIIQPRLEIMSIAINAERVGLVEEG